jgi:hypothetical protein
VLRSDRPQVEGAPAADRWPRLAIAALCLTAALAAFGPIYRAQFIVEININEGWNAYYADAVAHGRPLYPSPDKLITNNYPPLSFLIVAGVASLAGSPVLVGRAISLVALLVISAGIYCILRELRVRRWPAFLAALAYGATMCRLYDNLVGVNDPQLLANAMTTLGFLLFVKERSSAGSWFAGSTLLMACAGFVKPFLIAMPASALVILLIEDRRAALRFALSGAAFALGGLVVCRLSYGPDFASNVFAARPYAFLRGLKALEDLHRIVIPLLAWLWCIATTKDGARRRIINILCAFGGLESFVARGAEQVYYNAGFDLVIAAHLALGAALEQMGNSPLLRRWPALQARKIVIFGIALRLLFGEKHDAFHAVYSPQWRRSLRVAEATTISEADRVARIPGPVFCGSTLVCYLARKPFVVDPINVELRIAIGALPADALDRLYRSGQLTFVPANPRAIFARH